MASKKLSFQHDVVGDILYTEKCPPYAEQESDELGDEVVARFSPQTGEIESLEMRSTLTDEPAAKPARAIPRDDTPAK